MINYNINISIIYHEGKNGQQVAKSRGNTRKMEIEGTTTKDDISDLKNKVSS